MSTPRLNPLHSWREALLIYLQPKALAMLALGFTAGIPLLLIFSTLSIWLVKAGIDRAEVTYFSWAALGYSFKFIWAPLMDRLPLPFLHSLLGRRRSWLLVAQLLVITAIIQMALSDPTHGLGRMAFAAVLLGFAAASQDIVIDALRIELVEKEFQAALSAMYIGGYRIGMITSGAGALYLASGFGGGEGYVYSAWMWTYLVMAACMGVGIVTNLFLQEPLVTHAASEALHGTQDYVRFLLMFIFVTGAFVFGFIHLDPAVSILNGLAHIGIDGAVAVFMAQVMRLALAIATAVITAWVLLRAGAVNHAMVFSTYVEPVRDFLQRYRKLAVLMLLLVGVYRMSDIVLGVISNVFYLDMGYNMIQIAEYTKVFGLVMTLLGGFLGGVLTVRFGVMRILMLGAILSSLTNLLFMLLAGIGNHPAVLATVIAADNLSAGIASAAFVAYLSGLTSISFTAVQYAILSSLMTLLPKVIGGYSGGISTTIGYSNFFLLTTLLGLPAILLVLYLMRHAPVHNVTIKSE